jgi:uncharacterized membrane protein YfcA
VAGGLFGVGGPLLSVPLLVLAGVPMMPALGAAQAQSIVIAAVGTIAYAAQDAISWPLALLVGVPELAGVVIGWRVAHALPTHRLRYGLAAALVALGPYLVLRGGWRRVETAAPRSTSAAVDSSACMLSSIISSAARARSSRMPATASRGTTTSKPRT